MNVPAYPAPAYAATDGAAYDWFLGRWTARLADPLIDFAGLREDGDLLEVGCGTGALARRLASRFPDRQISATDISPAYIAHARTQEKGTGGGIRYLIGDAQRLTYPDGAFAGTLAQLVLNFVPDAMAAASEMRRVTRRGGVAAASVWDFGGGLVYQRLFWDTASTIDEGAAAARDSLFSGPLAQAGGLASLWLAAGFGDVVTGSLTVRMDYVSFDDYWRPLLGGQGPVGTYVKSLLADRQELVRHHVRRAYLAGRDDGPRSMAATAWAVRGVAG
jgi:SAM-dependent methyltransferase